LNRQPSAGQPTQLARLELVVLEAELRRRRRPAFGCRNDPIDQASSSSCLVGRRSIERGAGHLGGALLGGDGGGGLCAQVAAGVDPVLYFLSCYALAGAAQAKAQAAKANMRAEEAAEAGES
jgi:hypothetical protein